MDRRRMLIASASATFAAMGLRARAEGVVAAPRLNQVGFAPAARKVFAVAVPPDGALPGFEVLAEDGRVVFSGALSAPRRDLSATTGGIATSGDFSAVRQAGQYRVRIGAEVSHPFVIGDGVYRPLLHDAARAFYLIRANAATDDPRTGIHVAAGHTADSHVLVDGEMRDLSGGWYNAGDFGKYTHMHAMSVSHMLRLYELRPKVAELGLDLPAQLYPGLPALLQMARWGLEWLLRMQNADGGVLHKVDSQPTLAWGMWPADDPNPRHAMPASAIDAGVFTGVMGHASRVLKARDPALAARCRAAAQRAWAWLERHPDVNHTDAYYLDADMRQEILWGQCEKALMDGVPNDKIQLPDIGVAFEWPTPQVLGLMSLALNGHARARAMILDGARTIGAQAGRDPYGYSAAADSYSWESNETVLDAATVCLYADRLDPTGGYRDTAQGLFDYLLGRNVLDRSFVTAHGARPAQHPFHWIYKMSGIAVPGWAVGGANGQPAGVDGLLLKVIQAGTPPAQCYVDGQSYASNEGETSENAALVFVAGMLL